MAFTTCFVPAEGSTRFELGEGEMEIGVGIHGEAGRERMPLKSGDEIAEMLAVEIIEDPVYERIVQEWDNDKGEWVDVELVDTPFQAGDQVLAYVNGMGGTPVPELYVVYRKLMEVCEKKGLTIVRNLIGTYITAMEMVVSTTSLSGPRPSLRQWRRGVRHNKCRAPEATPFAGLTFD